MFSHIVTYIVKVCRKAPFIFFLNLVSSIDISAIYRHIKLILICRARYRRASNRLDRIYAMEVPRISSRFLRHVMLILTFTVLRKC